MAAKDKSKILIWLILLVTGGWFATAIVSCGKQSAASAAGLNIEYRVINLSPDLFPVNLFSNYVQQNANPFTFEVDQGYFYVKSLVMPYQFRTALTVDTTLFSRSDSLKSGFKYTLYITGTKSDNSIKQIFTVDTSASPALGRGKVRFVDASPQATAGLDLYANGSPVFTKIAYPNYTAYRELPVGNYDFQITNTGSSSVLKDLPGVTIQDGKLYTIYSFGYATRIDSAQFNAAVIVNK